MVIREVHKDDLKQLLELYTQLHDNLMPQFDKKLEKLWDSILLDKNHHIIVGFVADKLISSCVLVIIPNLTHNLRPYALIENVITREGYREKGYATSVLNFARNLAKKENCYKLMLLTSAKKESTLNFYEKAGYSRHDKTAFIQWI